MWSQAAYSNHTHDTPLKVKWIFLAALLCMYMGCVVLYITISNASTQITEFTRSLLLEVEHMKEREEATLEFIIRLTKQQEQRIVRQNALMQNLMSQSEVIFQDVEIIYHDIEIISQFQERRRPKFSFLNNTTSFDSLSKVADLGYHMEHARRRSENIVKELWYFVHDQLKELNKAIAAEKELNEDKAHSRQKNKSQVSQQTHNDSIISNTQKNNSQVSQQTHNDSIISNAPLSNDSKMYTEEPDLNKTSEKASEATLNISNISIASEQDEEDTSFATEDKEDNQDTETNNPNSFVDVIEHKLQMFSQQLTGYRRTLTDALSMLRNADYSEKVRQFMSRELGSLVQRRLHFIQNPKNCWTAQKVACSMKSCGFGCNFHHFVYCLITAYSKNKTLLMYTSGSWAALLEPASFTCFLTDPRLDMWPIDNQSIGVETLPIIEELADPHRGHIPLNVPKDLAVNLATFHGNPAAWWIGQIASYLFKPTPVLMDHINLLKKKLGFKKPIVGVHVRRTDKLSAEASYHSLEEYMIHVEDYFDQVDRSQPAVTRRVFLATDDSTLLPEAREKYPNYTFLSDPNGAEISIEDRESVNAVKGIATDIYFLSRTDFLVCTFSSQVCRLAYELMQALHGDASEKFCSLDDIYYFGGQVKHRMVAVESYQADPAWQNTISLKKGDSISVAGNHWNGFSMGVNERTSRAGLYPSYLVEDTVESYPMPIYPNVH